MAGPLSPCLVRGDGGRGGGVQTGRRLAGAGGACGAVPSEPLAAVILLEDEDLMHVATAASGSAPAYFYAFIEALEAAAVSAGLAAGAAADMVRATLAGAAALLRRTGEAPAELRRRV